MPSRLDDVRSRAFPLSLVILLLGLACKVVPPPEAPESPPSPVVARYADSSFTLDRLQAWLGAHPDTLAREEIEAFLIGWIEAQIYHEAARERGLLADPRVRERLAELRGRFVRGLLEESLLQMPIEVSEREMKRWARQHPGRLTLQERQIKLAWYASEDSLQLVTISRSLERNQLKRTQLTEPGLAYGKTPFVGKDEVDARLAEEIFSLQYLDISPVLRLDDQFLLYQVVGNRPKGYLLSLDSAEGEVRQMLEEEKQLERLRAEMSRLREQAEYQIDLDPLFAVD